MTKEEFIKEVETVREFPFSSFALAQPIEDKDYQIIEEVYAFHPSISNTEGKKQVAWLYVNFGLRIFLDMLPTAKRMEDLENQISSVRHELNKLIERQQKIANPSCQTFFKEE